MISELDWTHVGKIVFYSAWMFFGVILNIFCIIKGKATTYFNALLRHLTVVNILVIVLCIGTHFILSITTVWVAGDVACTFFKTVQTFTLMFQNALFLFVASVLKNKKTMEKIIKDKLCVIWILCSWLSVTQVRDKLFGVYNILILLFVIFK